MLCLKYGSKMGGPETGAAHRVKKWTIRKPLGPVAYHHHHHHHHHHHFLSNASCASKLLVTLQMMKARRRMMRN